MSKFFVVSFLLLVVVVNAAFGQIDFDGTDDYISTSTMGNLGSDLDTKSVTFACWLKTSNTSQLMGLCGTNNDSWDTSFFIIINANYQGDFSANYIHCTVNDESNNAIIGGTKYETDVADGSWHCLMVKYQYDNDRLFFIIDNVEKETSYQKRNTLVNPANFTANFLIGSYNEDGTPTTFFDGVIDEAVLWNTKTSSFIDNQFYAGGVKRLMLQFDTNMLAYWSLDDLTRGASADGATLRDIFGGNDGTGVGGTAVSESLLTY